MTRRMTLMTILAATIAMAAHSGEIGPEVWIDGPEGVQPGADQDYPDVAVDSRGRRVYVWEAFGVDLPDRSEIFMRRFDAAGTPIDATPIQVNTYTTNDQRRARLAVAGDGSFLVVWESDEIDLDAYGSLRKWVRGRAFDSSGQPVGSEQLLSASSRSATPIHVDAAARRGADGANAGFVVVWHSFYTPGDDGYQSIQGRLVHADGSPSGAQFQVNSFTPYSQMYPAVTELTDGGFLVAWARPGATGRRFGSDGMAVGEDFLLSTEFDNPKTKLDAALGWNGQVLVTWEDPEDPGDDNEIRGRWFDGALSPIGNDFRINTYTTNIQSEPHVADHGPLGFLVTWESVGGVGTDSSMNSIESRLVTGPGTFGGAQTQLNVFEEGRQGPSAAHGLYGWLAATWRSAEKAALEDDVITARQIEHCIFCDDFEWGSAWRWSQTVP